MAFPLDFVRRHCHVALALDCVSVSALAFVSVGASVSALAFVSVSASALASVPFNEIKHTHIYNGRQHQEQRLGQRRKIHTHITLQMSEKNAPT